MLFSSLSFPQLQPLCFACLRCFVRGFVFLQSEAHFHLPPEPCTWSLLSEWWQLWIGKMKDTKRNRDGRIQQLIDEQIKTCKATTAPGLSKHFYEFTMRTVDKSSLESNVLERCVLMWGVQLPCFFFSPTLPPFQRKGHEGNTAAMQQSKSREPIKCLWLWDVASPLFLFLIFTLPSLCCHTIKTPTKWGEEEEIHLVDCYWF